MAAFPPARSSPCAERRATEQVREMSSQHVTTVEMNRLFAALTAFMIMAVLAAAPQSASAADGKTVYAEFCVVCHGEHGDGNTRLRRGLTTPPRDFTSAVSRRELSRERMINSVTHGRPGTAMQAIGTRLTEEEIAAVDHFRASFMTGAGAKETRPPKMVLGEQLYVRNCAVCHGDKGNGAMWTQSSLNPSPRDFTAAAAREELSRERMITSVTYGRPGTAMMSFRKRLSAEEIETVVDYIRTNFFMKGPAPASPHPEIVQADMSLPFPGNLKGDVGKGKEFYEHNCFTCHGLEGNGQGPCLLFIYPKPRNFLAEESRLRLNRRTLFNAVHVGLRGTVMPAWGRVLSDQEIANVAEYVFTAFVHPAAAASAARQKEPKKQLREPSPPPLRASRADSRFTTNAATSATVIAATPTRCPRVI